MDGCNGHCLCFFLYDNCAIICTIVRVLHNCGDFAHFMLILKHGGGEVGGGGMPQLGNYGQ